MTVKISEMTATFSNASVNYTGIGMNVNLISAGVNSKLLDLKVNSNSVFSVNSTGSINSTGGIELNINSTTAAAGVIPLNIKVNGNSVFSINSTGYPTSGFSFSGFFPEQAYYYNGISTAWRDQPLPSSANLAVIVSPRAATFPANLVGSSVKVTKTAQIGALNLALNKNGVLVANIGFTAGSTNSTINSTAFSVVAGDVLTLTSPISVTAIGLAYTFIGV